MGTVSTKYLHNVYVSCQIQDGIHSIICTHLQKTYLEIYSIRLHRHLHQQGLVHVQVNCRPRLKLNDKKNTGFFSLKCSQKVKCIVKYCEKLLCKWLSVYNWHKISRMNLHISDVVTSSILNLQTSNNVMAATYFYQNGHALPHLGQFFQNTTYYTYSS